MYGATRKTWHSWNAMDVFIYFGIVASALWVPVFFTLSEIHMSVKKTFDYNPTPYSVTSSFLCVDIYLTNTAANVNKFQTN